MDDIARRAMLGDRQAQDEVTARGELLPCPFCGGKAVMIEGDDFLTVRCESCETEKSEYGDCYDEGFMLDTYGSCLKRRWNSRVSVPQPDGSEKVRTAEDYRRAMSFLSVGVMPTDNMLRAAGIDKESARYMKYKALRGGCKMKPILFNTEMVRAILEGRKTVTRRVVKPHYRPGETGWQVITEKHSGKYVRIEYLDEWGNETRYMIDPFRPGDILYVRETWYKDVCRYMFKANYSDTEKFFRDGKEVQIKWRPSINMPKEAARLFLRVTDVRVERLKEISVSSAMDEGFSDWNDFVIGWNRTIPKHKNKFKRHPYYWEDNPWVWVIEFERCEKPKEDEV